MAQPVWVLSVDLQAKTATFQSGLASAARSARSSFQQIGSSSKEMAGEVAGSHQSVRSSIGLLDNTIRGNHAGAMADLVRMFAQTSAGMTAMPFLPVIGLIALFVGTVVGAIHVLREWGEEQRQLANAQSELGMALSGGLNGLEEKLLQAGIRADDLHNNHLAALAKQLRLIDLQTMGDLIKQLELVARAADSAFAKQEAGWYQFGTGSEGAKRALEEFKVQYDSLVAQGKTEEASGLLKGTLAQANSILAAQNAAKEATGGFAGTLSGGVSDPEKYANALTTMSAVGVSFTQKEIAAQQTLVSLLQAQLDGETRIQAIRKLEGQNAKDTTANEAAQRRAEGERQQAASAARIGELQIRSDRATADARLQVANAAAEQRLATDLDFAERERDVKASENQAQIAALDKSGKDYTNQLAALRQKGLEIEMEYGANTAELKAKAGVEIARRDLETMQEGIREQIDATQQGTNARLAAIDRGIRAEQAKGLQNTEFYRRLLQERVATQEKIGEEAGKMAEEAGKQQAAADQRFGELDVEALKEHYALVDSASAVSRQQRVLQETNAANLEYQVKARALQLQINTLDKSGKEYINKLRQLQNEELLLTKAHEAQLAHIAIQAQQEQNSALKQGWMQFSQMSSQALTQSIMGHQSWAKTLDQIGNQVVSGMIRTALMSLMTDDMDKERDAAKAARKMYLAGMQLPFPLNMVAAPIMAAGAFATVMAFNEGGIVPGIGSGDSVPALLTPGEGVVPKGVMEGLSDAARNGGLGGSGQTVHVHVRPTYNVNTIDHSGMRDALNKHTDLLTDHFHKAIRKTNKR